MRLASWFFLLSLFAATTGHADDSLFDCYKRNLGNLLTARPATTTTSYVVEDPSNPKFYVAADRVGDELYLDFFLRDSKTGERSDVLSGSEQFQAALRHFKSIGYSIRRIAGEWTQGDNLNEFNRLTAKGLDPEYAASLTWTGKQAFKEGFQNAHVAAVGKPGKYTFVHVWFSK